MKKIYALILAVIMIISLFGCADGTAPVGETDTTVNTEATLGEHNHDHGDETIGSTEGTENTEATEDATAPTDAETIPDSPDDIGNGGVEDDPAKNMTEPTQPAPTEPKHEHDYKSKVTNPTCDSKGYTTYTCTCGDSYTGNETRATGHDYKSETVKPTCDSDGYTKHTCTKCGKSYTDGKTSATGHKYETKTVAPTTEAEGYDLHTCSKCGKSYKDNYKDKLPAPTEHVHEWVFSEHVGPEACREGYMVYKCACGETKTEGTGDRGDCNWEAQYSVPPTTEEMGYTVYKCSVCGNTWTDYDREKLPAPTEPAPTEPAECTNHEASEEVLASVTVKTTVYRAYCYCDYHTDYKGDTREEAIAKCNAHIAEHGGESEKHFIRELSKGGKLNYPTFFECINCGKVCNYSDYYDYAWSEHEYFKYGERP